MRMVTSLGMMVRCAALMGGLIVTWGIVCQGDTSSPISGLFVFGDSLVDDGNNNYIPSLARSNFYPYGIDFPLGPTGRFCNGRTVIDAVGQLLGFPFVPAYLNPKSTGPAILRGVNYASAAGGILDSAGKNYIARLPFNTQIENFKFTLINLRGQLGGEDQLANYLAKSVFAIVFGSNDYLNNYFINSTGLSQKYTPDAYSRLVAGTFAQQLTTLYELGARKFVIAGVGPLGCIPNVLATKSKDGRCVTYINEIIRGFNAQVLQMVNQLNADPRLPGATFLYAKVYEATVELLNNPSRYGFTVTDTGCCGVGKNRGQLTCILPLATLCPDRTTHVWWDAFHPTDAANLVLARGLVFGDSSAIVPINIQQLANL